MNKQQTSHDVRTHGKRFLWILVCLSPVGGLAANAADWPQYKGPARNDISAETNLLSQWPTNGPPLVWTFADAGVGLSGPEIVGDRLFTLGGRGDTEYLIALEVYANTNLANHHGNVVLVGDHNYGFGQGRGLVCQEFLTGEVVWSERKLRPGALTCADGRFYCYGETHDDRSKFLRCRPAIEHC